MHWRLPLFASILLFLFVGVAWAEDGGIVLPAKTLPSSERGASVDEWLDPEADAWRDAPRTPLRLSRTPPVYFNGPYDDGARPRAEARLLRSGDTLLFRLNWDDVTENLAPKGERYPDAGDASIYKLHTENEFRTFPDAVCVMVPRQRGPHAVYPSAMMGDKTRETDMFYWRAGVGFQHLTAHGRASTQKTPDIPKGRTARGEGGWSVVMAIDGMPAGTPVIFAIWDGAKEQRDGLKYFSIWYEVP